MCQHLLGSGMLMQPHWLVPCIHAASGSGDTQSKHLVQMSQEHVVCDELSIQAPHDLGVIWYTTAGLLL